MTQQSTFSRWPSPCSHLLIGLMVSTITSIEFPMNLIFLMTLLWSLPLHQLNLKKKTPCMMHASIIQPYLWCPIKFYETFSFPKWWNISSCAESLFDQHFSIANTNCLTSESQWRKLLWLISFSGDTLIGLMWVT